MQLSHRVIWGADEQEHRAQIALISQKLKALYKLLCLSVCGACICCLAVCRFGNCGVAMVLPTPHATPLLIGRQFNQYSRYYYRSDLC